MTTQTEGLQNPVASGMRIHANFFVVALIFSQILFEKAKESWLQYTLHICRRVATNLYTDFSTIDPKLGEKISKMVT
jgi:hypothetical protein